MKLKIICSNARVGDRAAGLVDGARLTARELQRRTGLAPLYVGVGSTEPVDDNWPQALEEARTTLTAMQQATHDALSTPGLSLFTNNTCSISIATLPVAAQRLPDLKVLWIDAHGDYNNPDSTQTGYLGGMALAAATGSWDSGYGSGVKPTNVALVGARDIDETERRLIDTDGVSVIAPQTVSPTALRDFVGDDPVWLHIDWDVLEPGNIPADYEVPNGLMPQQVSDILAALTDARIIAVELAEFQASPTDNAVNRRALDCLLDTISPLIDD